ncbi:hypothetical protein ANN_11467 [Periplaneta americana]|uniref:Uncharacterized protein n=1 Tax=Periplaneta americana TaxID=6978 RepID=A0ABQ8T537_PERAM|nr:hypothetical protein ANN_11467 [Periplaneta americana]
MAGICEGGNEPAGSLKAICNFQKGKEKSAKLQTTLTAKYPEGKPIKTAKYNHVMTLMIFIPVAYQEFYPNLKPENSPDDYVEDIDVHM